MKVQQSRWSEGDGWTGSGAAVAAQLVLVFGNRASLIHPRLGPDLQARWPGATILGCSTAGQISGTEVFDAGVVATAVQFEHTQVRPASAPVTAADSAAAGATLAKALAAPDLVHVIVISEGLDINGEALVRGLGEHLPAHVSVTGGLSADGELFQETAILFGGTPRANKIGRAHV